MKVAIMTQPLGTNYGGIMQAYALQKVLAISGCEVTTIDYRSPPPPLKYKLARLGYRIIKKLFGVRKSPVFMERHYSEIFSNTNDFVIEYINTSDRVESSLELALHFKKHNYDMVVVGSDQTWRPKYSPNIYDYFLNFLEGNNIKRIAYATSFGVDSWEYSEEETTRCASLASRFDKISVRESSGVELCKKYFDANADLVLDPTMLLNKNEYLKLIGRSDSKERGVFCYVLDRSQAKREIISGFSQHLGKSIFTSYARLPVGDVSSSNIEDYKMPKIEKWLQSFGSANFVVTDSFHGCVFSIIFNVPFIVIANPKRGVARFESILSSLGLIDRMVFPGDEIDFVKLCEPINWDEVNTKLEELKKYSFSFLKGIKALK